MTLFKQFKDPAELSLVYKQFRKKIVRKFAYEHSIIDSCLKERK